MNNFNLKNIILNNKKEKNVFNKLTADSEIKSEQHIFSTVNNTLNKLVNTDLYIENKINQYSANINGPININTSADINCNENIPEFKKYWNVYNDNTEPLTIYKSFSDDLSNTLFEIQKESDFSNTQLTSFLNTDVIFSENGISSIQLNEDKKTITLTDLNILNENEQIVKFFNNSKDFINISNINDFVLIKTTQDNVIKYTIRLYYKSFENIKYIDIFSSNTQILDFVIFHEKANNIFKLIYTEIQTNINNIKLKVIDFVIYNNIVFIKNNELIYNFIDNIIKLILNKNNNDILLIKDDLLFKLKINLNDQNKIYFDNNIFDFKDFNNVIFNNKFILGKSKSNDDSYIIKYINLTNELTNEFKIIEKNFKTYFLFKKYLILIYSKYIDVYDLNNIVIKEKRKNKTNYIEYEHITILNVDKTDINLKFAECKETEFQNNILKVLVYDNVKKQTQLLICIFDTINNINNQIIYDYNSNIFNNIYFLENNILNYWFSLNVNNLLDLNNLDIINYLNLNNNYLFNSVSSIISVSNEKITNNNISFKNTFETLSSININDNILLINNEDIKYDYYFNNICFYNINNILYKFENNNYSILNYNNKNLNINFIKNIDNILFLFDDEDCYLYKNNKIISCYKGVKNIDKINNFIIILKDNIVKLSNLTIFPEIIDFSNFEDIYIDNNILSCETRNNLDKFHGSKQDFLIVNNNYYYLENKNFFAIDYKKIKKETIKKLSDTYWHNSKNNNELIDWGKNNLNSNKIINIIPDNRNGYYITTNNGILRYCTEPYENGYNISSEYLGTYELDSGHTIISGDVTIDIHEKNSNVSINDVLEYYNLYPWVDFKNVKYIDTRLDGLPSLFATESSISAFYPNNTFVKSYIFGDPNNILSSQMKKMEKSNKYYWNAEHCLTNKIDNYLTSYNSLIKDPNEVNINIESAKIKGIETIYSLNVYQDLNTTRDIYGSSTFIATEDNIYFDVPEISLKNFKQTFFTEKLANKNIELNFSYTNNNFNYSNFILSKSAKTAFYWSSNDFNISCDDVSLSDFYLDNKSEGKLISGNEYGKLLYFLSLGLNNYNYNFILNDNYIDNNFGKTYNFKNSLSYFKILKEKQVTVNHKINFETIVFDNNPFLINLNGKNFPKNHLLELGKHEKFLENEDTYYFNVIKNENTNELNLMINSLNDIYFEKIKSSKEILPTLTDYTSKFSLSDNTYIFDEINNIISTEYSLSCTQLENSIKSNLVYTYNNIDNILLNLRVKCFDDKNKLFNKNILYLKNDNPHVLSDCIFDSDKFPLNQKIDLIKKDDKNIFIFSTKNEIYYYLDSKKIINIPNQYEITGYDIYNNNLFIKCNDINNHYLYSKYYFDTKTNEFKQDNEYNLFFDSLISKNDSLRTTYIENEKEEKNETIIINNNWSYTGFQFKNTFTDNIRQVNYKDISFLSKNTNVENKKIYDIFNENNILFINKIFNMIFIGTTKCIYYLNTSTMYFDLYKNKETIIDYPIYYLTQNIISEKLYLYKIFESENNIESIFTNNDNNILFIKLNSGIVYIDLNNIIKNIDGVLNYIPNNIEKIKFENVYIVNNEINKIDFNSFDTSIQLFINNESHIFSYKSNETQISSYLSSFLNDKIDKNIFNRNILFNDNFPIYYYNDLNFCLKSDKLYRIIENENTLELSSFDNLININKFKHINYLNNDINLNCIFIGNKDNNDLSVSNDNFNSISSLNIIINNLPTKYEITNNIFIDKHNENNISVNNIFIINNEYVLNNINNVHQLTKWKDYNYYNIYKIEELDNSQLYNPTINFEYSDLFENKLSYLYKNEFDNKIYAYLENKKNNEFLIINSYNLSVDKINYDKLKYKFSVIDKKSLNIGLNNVFYNNSLIFSDYFDILNTHRIINTINKDYWIIDNKILSTNKYVVFANIYFIYTFEFKLKANELQSYFNNIDNIGKDILIATYNNLLKINYLYNNIEVLQDNGNYSNFKYILNYIKDKNNLYKSGYLVIKDNNLYSLKDTKNKNNISKLELDNKLFDNITDFICYSPFIYLLKNNDKLYLTQFKNVIEKDRILDFKNYSEIINNRYDSEFILDHDKKYHANNSFITELNNYKSSNLQESFINFTQDPVEIFNEDNNSYTFKTENDIVDTIIFSEINNTIIKAFYSNFTIGNKFLELTDISYIIKNYKSGLRELYIYLPTTNTYYINNIEGNIGCNKYIYETERKNISISGDIINNKTKGNVQDARTDIQLKINNDIINIKEIYSIEINGNSLPLKIYIDEEDSCSGAEKYFHSYILPSLVYKHENKLFIKDLKENVNIINMSVFGSDAQSIKILLRG